MKKMMHRFICLMAVSLILLGLLPVSALAEPLEFENKYYLGETVNTGRDNGFSMQNSIGKDDPHFGWNLGKFFVSGYTSVTQDSGGAPVFLKTVGDKVTLWFHLEQDIAQLNGEENLSISHDKNGYDEYFGVKPVDFGHGTLIIRHTDYQNKVGDPVVYTDYLAANAVNGDDIKVELFEEGDYEVALDYEIVNKDSTIKVLDKELLNFYTNYRIFFRFSVRNGNCMVFPFDAVTGRELANTAVTENGFYLDLAKSRYLDINVKKEVLKDGGEGLTEDVRFNRPAKDGDQYIDEGVYTITVRNRYADLETEKVIYVGSDQILKAYAANGLSIPEIKDQLAAGAKIDDNGFISFLGMAQEGAEEPDVLPESLLSEEHKVDRKAYSKYIALAGAAVLAVLVGLMIVNKRAVARHYKKITRAIRRRRRR